MLDQLVTGHVLLQEVADPQDRRSRRRRREPRSAQLRQRFPSEDEFKKALASRSLTLEKLREELKKQLAIEKMIETEVTPQVAVTDQDVKDFYDKNPRAVPAARVVARQPHPA